MVLQEPFLPEDVTPLPGGSSIIRQTIIPACKGSEILERSREENEQFGN